MKNAIYSLLSLKDIQNYLSVSQRTSERIFKKLKNHYKPKSNKLLIWHLFDFFDIEI